MRVEVLKRDRLRMARSAAVIAIAALVAGCSSDSARFDDSFYTGAVPKNPVPRGAVGQGQAYPGGIDQMSTGSVNRQLPPPTYGSNPGAGVQNGAYSTRAASPVQPVRTASVERSMLAPPASAPPASALSEPTYSEPSAPMPEPVAAAPAAPRPTKAGWQTTGNVVTLGAGESVETLSSRYGVPTKAILSANGVSSAADIRPGQQVQIPSYSYGQSPSAAKAAAAQPSGQTLGTPPGPLRAPTAAPVVAATRPAGASNAKIVVTSGDSVNGIARRAGVSPDALREANGITGDNIRIGQTLVMPNGAAAPKRVATLEPKAAPVAAPAATPVAPPKAAEPKPYVAPKVVAAAPADAAPAPVKQAAAAPAAAPAPTASVEDEADNDVATAAPAGTGISQFRWPVQGRVVKRYGEKSGSRRSDGVDISVPSGTPVKAAENGVVIYAGDGLKEFGNTVLVKHDNGLVTVYGHADQLMVKRGATVRRGQEIATAGTSGDIDTPMVHFEVRKNSAPVDPMTYLK